jgi:peptidoglycan/xylan/chitin deacetylase (PgdA/CDA1 family)
VCWWPCGGCTTAVDIVECPVRNQWGVTYDDGPAYYTPNLTNYLSQVDVKATFFVIGSRVVQFPKTLQLQYMNGHQIAVHTWSHHYMTTLTNLQIVAEFGWTMKVIKDVLGVTPNQWRPPFGDIDQRVRAISIAMGLTPVIWTRNNQTGLTFDTGDFNIVGGNVTAQQVIQNFENIVASAAQIDTGFIVLEHDLYEVTVELATGYILPDALANNPPFNMTPVISCLNMPMSNAYIETNDNSSNPPVISGPFVTTTVVPSSTAGSGTKSGSDARFSVGFSLMFIMSIITLLAGVYTVRL